MAVLVRRSTGRRRCNGRELADEFRVGFREIQLPEFRSRCPSKRRPQGLPVVEGPAGDEVNADRKRPAVTGLFGGIRVHHFAVLTASGNVQTGFLAALPDRRLSGRFTGFYLATGKLR